MSGRKSERSRKSINYSKFEVGENADSGDEDDFTDQTPPIKKTKKEKSTVKETKKNIRLSAEEKYAQEIELALRMSMNSAEEIPKAKTEVTVPSSEVSPNIENQNTQVVEAEVLNSPNSKPNKSSERTEEKRLCIVNNGAACITDDQIVSEPEQEVETNKRRSTRVVKEKKDDDDDFKLSDEEEEENDFHSEEIDYIETPKKSSKKNSRKPRVKENEKKKTNSTTKKTTNRKPGTPLATKSKQAIKDSKTIVKKTTVSAGGSSQIKNRRLSLNAVSSPTPRSPTVLLNRQNKFLQKGWTPPGPAGARTDALRSPQSPIIRVGLSRFAKLTPLHPNIGSK